MTKIVGRICKGDVFRHKIANIYIGVNAPGTYQDQFYIVNLRIPCAFGVAEYLLAEKPRRRQITRSTLERAYERVELVRSEAAKNFKPKKK